MKTKIKRKVSRKTLKKKANKLWSLIIRQKNNGKCEMCNKSANNPHHIIGKSNHAVRWDIRNGCLLCSGCHTMNNNSAHKDPQGFMIWLEEHRLGDYIYLLLEKNEIWDKDYDKVLEYLNKVIKLKDFCDMGIDLEELKKRGV